VIQEQNTEILFHLMRVAIGTEEAEKMLYSTNGASWRAVYNLARQQGVLAIVFDGLMQLFEADKEFAKAFPQALKFKWINAVFNIEQRYEQQLRLSAELAGKWAEQDIQTFCLKGLAISSYYPEPTHRECGDLDCFLPDNYERGNIIAEECGAKVERDFYKHSHISYKGLMVENHQFCTPIRGAKQYKQRERYLQILLAISNPQYIGNTKLIRPSCDFNALFLTTHSFGHFLTEGIRLRHILDWALFVKAEQGNIDWENFYAWCDKLGYTRFVNALNAIAVDYLGLDFCDKVVVDRALSERILHDVLYGGVSIFNQNMPKWRVRLAIVKSYMNSIWKYHKVYRRSVFVELMRVVGGFLFERTPKL